MLAQVHVVSSTSRGAAMIMSRRKVLGDVFAKAIEQWLPRLQNGGLHEGLLASVFGSACETATDWHSAECSVPTCLVSTPPAQSIHKVLGRTSV